MRKQGRGYRHAIVLACLAALFFLSSSLLEQFRDFFTVCGDEANLGYWARVMLRGPQALLNEHRHQIHLSLFGRLFPLEYIFYKGPGEYYSALAFVAAIEDPFKSLWLHARFYAVLEVCATFVLAYSLCESLAVGTLCALTVATSLSWVNSTLSGVVIGGLSSNALCVMALGLLVVAARHLSRPAWLGSCLFTGLAIGSAPQAFAFFLAWGVASVCLRQQLKTFWKGWSLVISGVLLALGLLPILVSNFLNSWSGLKMILKSIHITPAGINNLHYLHNLWVRIEQFPLMLSRDAFSLFPPLAAVAAVLQMSFLLRARSIHFTLSQKISLLPLATIVIVLLASPLTISSLRSAHLMPLFPLIICMLPATGQLLRPRLSSCWRMLSLLCLGILVGLQSDQLLRNWKTFPDKPYFPGGAWSGDVLAPAQWILRQKLEKFIIFSPSLSQGLFYLLNGSRAENNNKPLKTQSLLPRALSKTSYIPSMHPYLMFVETGTTPKDLGVLKQLIEKAVSEGGPTYFVFSSEPGAHAKYGIDLLQVAAKKHKKIVTRVTPPVYRLTSEYFSFYLLAT